MGNGITERGKGIIPLNPLPISNPCRIIPRARLVGFRGITLNGVLTTLIGLRRHQKDICDVISKPHSE